MCRRANRRPCTRPRLRTASTSARLLVAGDLAHLCAEEEAGDLEINEQDGAWRGDEPPGAPPAYRSAEAQRQAGEESDEELQRERPRLKRNRYVDDESKEGSEGDGDDWFNVFFELFPSRRCNKTR